MKKCVVSFADKTGAYQSKMKRLEKSLKDVRFDGDFLGFTDYKEINCEPHSVIPYKFKPMAIQKAIDLGYELILWCDSPIVAIKEIKPVFDHIQEHGYLFFDNIGHPLGRWTNQKALDHFKMTREEAMNVRMIMACVMGYSVNHPCQFPNHRGYEKELHETFFNYRILANKLYPGSWSDHRHDQTVMSFLIHEQGLKIQTGHETFFAYQDHYGVLPISESVCLISKG